jgi:hypothetical protein
MSDALRGKRAEIEVASLELGDQIVAEWLPILGITYDAKNDVLDVALQGVTHLIRQPIEIVVDLRPTGVTSVAVVDADGASQVITLKDPVALPPAATA